MSYFEIDPDSETINTADIDARIDELEDAKNVLSDPDLNDEEKDGYEFGEDEQEELDALIEFRDDLKPYVADWNYGETLINANHWEEYAEQFVREVYSDVDFDSFPCNLIDWSSVADELFTDYTEGSYNGTMFYGR